MNNTIVIQARMGSTRLPGKVLMPLGKHTVLDYVVSRCKKVDSCNRVIVATSTLVEDDIIVRWCEEHSVEYYRGSEHDVLSRFVEAVSKHNTDFIMRVTADNPFVDYVLANNMMSATINSMPVDFIKLAGEYTIGLAVEIISYEALLRIDKLGKESYHREHVTYYGYEHHELFNILSFPIPNSIRYPQFRLTLDTVEDYKLLGIIANYFEDDRYIPSEEVIHYLIKNPELGRMNSRIIQKKVN